MSSAGYAKLPSVGNAFVMPSLVFIENKGQIIDQYHNPRKDIQFKLNAPGIDIFIGNGQIHYQWVKAVLDSTQSKEKDLMFLQTEHLDRQHEEQKFETYRMDVELLNANIDAEVTAEESQGYYENYYLPQCPDGVTAHSFQKITYKNVYPNIDWVIYISSGKGAGSLKYDFIVHPGGNPKDIRLQYNGATSLSLEDGAFMAITPFGSISENKPYTYEAETKKEIPCSFLLRDNILGFEVAHSNETIIIDPQLEWATYYGGSARDGGKWWERSSTDALGNIFFCGETTSLNSIATSGSFKDTISGHQDAFVAKMSDAGILQWATYYGGDMLDYFYAVAAGGDGVYVGGETFSEGLATPGAYQINLNVSGPVIRPDALLVKFDGSGHRVWATYFGGDAHDVIDDMVTIGSRLVIGGTTSSPLNIATPGSHQPIYNNEVDAFLALFDTFGFPVWSTYYGGERREWFPSVNADKDGDIYLSGYTGSTQNIATPGSHKDTIIAGSIYEASFLAKFDSLGKRHWATYYGGNAGSLGTAIDTMGNIYMAGFAYSSNGIATPGSYKEKVGLESDAYIVKFNKQGVRQWGTYFGGDSTDVFVDIAIDKNEDICLVGWTNSISGIATSGAWKDKASFPTPVNTAGMFVKFDNDGNRLWGTYYGDNGRNALHSIAIDNSNHIYLYGTTESTTGIATPGAHQELLGGWRDYFLVKANPDSLVYLDYPDSVICFNSTGAHARVGYIVSRSFRPGNVFTVQLSDINGSFLSPDTIGTKAGTASGYIDCVIPVNTPRGKGYRIRVLSSAPYYISDDNGIDIEIKDGPEKPIASGDTSICAGDRVLLSATCSTPGVSFSWSGPNGFNVNTASHLIYGIGVAGAGDYIVTVSPPECKMTDTVHVSVRRTPNKPVITHNAPICEGDTLVFNYEADTDSNTFYTISWPDPNAILGQHSILDSATRNFTGEYIVVASLDGCITRDTTFIHIKARPVLTFTTNSPVYAGGTLELYVTADSADTYLWEGPDGFTSILQKNTIIDVTSFNSGEYIVTSSYNDCVSVDHTIVQVLDHEEDILVLFPNPNDGRFTIKGNLKADQQIQMIVTNAAGQKIYRDKIASTRKRINHTVTLPAVANGSYFLHMRISGKGRVIPFVVGK